MKLYLAGPMRGIVDHNFPTFDAAAERLRALGHEVVNPADLSRDSGIEYASDGTCTIEQFRELLTVDLAWLVDCDGIALLPGWQKSQGARFELLFALMVGMQVLTSDGEVYAMPPAIIANVIFDGKIVADKPHEAAVTDRSYHGRIRIDCSCNAWWTLKPSSNAMEVMQSINDHYHSAGQKKSEVL